MIPFLQRVLSYALTGSGEERFFFILHGNGRNGKTTLLEAFRHVMGDCLATVKELMRHKSIDMTLRYSHLSPRHKESAVDALVSAYTETENGALQNA